MLRRSLLAACAVAALVAPSVAHADDASLTAVVTAQHERMIAYEERLAEWEPKGLRAANRMIQRYAVRWRALCSDAIAAVKPERATSDRAARGRQLLLASWREDVVVTELLGRSMKLLNGVRRSTPRKQARRELRRGALLFVRAMKRNERVERRRERGLARFGIEYDSPVLEGPGGGATPFR